MNESFKNINRLFFFVSILILLTFIPLFNNYENSQNPFCKIYIPKIKGYLRFCIHFISVLMVLALGIYIYIITPSGFILKEYWFIAICEMLLLFPPFMQLIKFTLAGQFQYFIL